MHVFFRGADARVHASGTVHAAAACVRTLPACTRPPLLQHLFRLLNWPCVTPSMSRRGAPQSVIWIAPHMRRGRRRTCNTHGAPRAAHDRNGSTRPKQRSCRYRNDVHVAGNHAAAANTGCKYSEQTMDTQHEHVTKALAAGASRVCAAAAARPAKHGLRRARTATGRKRSAHATNQKPQQR